MSNTGFAKADAWAYTEENFEETAEASAPKAKKVAKKAAPAKKKAPAKKAALKKAAVKKKK
jgi:hypothetical protein